MKDFILVSVVVMSLCAYASADIQYAGPPGGGTYNYPGGGNVGTEFIANENLTLTKLGIFDYGSNGLGNAHTVGLWTSGGALLTSLTIPAGTGTPLASGYRWADASPVTLVQGQSYIIGAFYSDGADWFVTNATIDPVFTLVTDLYRDGAPFAMPTTTYLGSGQGWYGPNLQAVPVPVPAAVLLGLLGLGAAGLKLRKFA
jgi:hypothetical protein